MLWSHGASVTDEAGKVSPDSPSTIRALEYARALYDTFVEGTISWSDASNNQAFLAGQNLAHQQLGFDTRQGARR
jgi:multiple sugar transport system substrate-binding protein